MAPRPVTVKAYTEGLPETIPDDNKTHRIGAIYNFGRVKWSDCVILATDSEGTEYEGHYSTETATAYSYPIKRDSSTICDVQIQKGAESLQIYAKILPGRIDEITITEVRFAY